MSKKAVPNKTFRLSALAAAIMSINSMTATAACTVTDGVVELDGISCTNTEILENTRVEITGTNPGLTNDGEIIGAISAKDSFNEAIIETVLIEGGSGATVTNSGDLVADNLSDDATAVDDIAIGIMISTDEADNGDPINLTDVTITNTGDVEAENSTGNAVGILVEPDLDDMDEPVGTISNVTITNGAESNIEATSTDSGAAGVLVIGEQVTTGIELNNAGQISAEGERSFAVGLEDLKAWIEGGPASATLNNSGKIGEIPLDPGVGGEEDDPAILAKVGVSIEDADADQYVVVNNQTGGKIVGTEIAIEAGAIDFETFDVVGAGKVDINNDGTIDGGATGSAIAITGDTDSKITNNGMILGGLGVSVESSSGSTEIVNNKAITAGASGISVEAGSVDVGASTITNGAAGVISTTLDAVGNCEDDFGDTECWANGIYVEGGADHRITNEGSITVTNALDHAGDDFASGIDVVAGVDGSGPVPVGIDLTGAMITNAGDLTVTNSSGEAIGILVAPDFEPSSVSGISIVNSGDVTVTGGVGAGVSIFGEQKTSDVSIENSGDIEATGTDTSWGVGIEDLKALLSGDPTLTLDNSGNISGATGVSIDDELDGEQTSPDSYVVISNQSGGNITGSEVGVAIGVIDDFGAGPVTIGAGKVDINNDGTIDGGATGVGINIVGDSAATITNTSSTTIKGNVGIESASTSTALSEPGSTDGGYGLILENAATGTISGTGAAIKNTEGNISVTNLGMIAGDVMLMGDNSILVMEGGTVTGDVTLGGAETDLDLVSGTIDGSVIGNPANGGTELLFIDGPGEITGDVTDVGSVDFFGGTHTIGGAVSTAGFLEVYGGAISILNGATVDVGGVENGGTIELAGLMTTPSYTGETQDDVEEGLIGSTGTLYFVIDPEGTSAKLVSDAVTLSDTDALGAKTLSPAEEGAAFHVVEATTLTLPTDTTVADLDVQWAGGLNQYVAVAGDDTDSLGDDATGDANDVFFIAQGVALEEAVTDPKLTGLVKVLSPLLSNPPAELADDPGFQKLLEVLATGDNAAIARTLREVSQKGVVGSVASGAMGGGGGNGKGGGGGASGGVETAFLRLDEIRLAEAIEEDRGVNTGDRAAPARGFWVRTGYNQADQDERDGVDGYKAETGTFSMGVDTEMGGAGTVGLAYLYADSEVEPDGPKSTIDVDTHAFTLYGSTMLGGHAVDLALTYADHGFDSTRTMTGFTGQAKSDYDGETLALRVGSEWSQALSGGWHVVPSVALTWSETEVDDYRETSTGTMLAMDVKMDDIEALVAKAGVALKGKFKSSGTTWAPKVFANVYHDFEGEQPSASVAFASAAGSRFNSEGAEPEKTLYELGFGLTGYQSSNFKLTGQYGYSTQNDFAGHALSLMARLRY